MYLRGAHVVMVTFRGRWPADWWPDDRGLSLQGLDIRQGLCPLLDEAVACCAGGGESRAAHEGRDVEADVVQVWEVGGIMEETPHHEQWADGVLPRVELGEELRGVLQDPDPWPGGVLCAVGELVHFFR